MKRFALTLTVSCCALVAQTQTNIILCMADDLGWGDVGYNGNKIIKTPHIDRMASEGLQFNRFYTSSPVCSPTRGGCLTGRHPYRYGIFFANEGHLKREEITLGEVLKKHGYSTGHFGKWHLGTLTKTEKDANRGGPKYPEEYSPPWLHGFDVCFSTESKVPTYNPMLTPVGYLRNTDPSKPFGTYYWNQKGEKVNDGLEGDDSQVIMDRAIPFIDKEVKKGNPFFAVIWFHTPHLPVVAGPEHKNKYKQYADEEQNYYGAVTAMDEQIGRLRAKLKELGVDKNTMLWFCSDNGPEGDSISSDYPGSAGQYRGRKRSLYEGGIHVPGILVWPEKVKKHTGSNVIVSTLDYFPTVMNVLKYPAPDARPIDGISILPLIEGKMKNRPVPLGFESPESLQAFMDNQYKILSNDKGKTFELYDILNDKYEKHNIASNHPEIVSSMKEQLGKFIESCNNSNAGADY